MLTTVSIMFLMCGKINTAELISSLTSSIKIETASNLTVPLYIKFILPAD